MAGRAAPTARRTRLGTELRKMREHAGMTTTQAASLLGTSSGQLSNIEVARFGVSADRIRVMARIYSCTDPALTEALAEMTGDRKRGWWEEYREILPPRLLDLAEIEHYGTHLHAAHSMHVPGLLQTVDYAREIFRQAVPEMSPPEIEHRISFRVKRQTVLYRDDAVPYRAVIHEAALRMKFGGPNVTRAQLRHLVEMCDRPRVTIRVIPFDAGSYPGSGQSVYFVSGSVPALDTAQLDQSHGPVFIDSEAQLAQYRMLLERLEATALSPTESQNLIQDLGQSL
ncbi:Scr1 family TA system antitoxin-like transcriptional regulator [Streptomyces sp. NPDC003247]|uniref:Scr1 family TA system antitoxin-like transcriptional regulator n=1 Tax=Streptomyces sp. NPDC003247 TaxID=3364677 RepID=UPI003688C083